MVKSRGSPGLQGARSFTWSDLRVLEPRISWSQASSKLTVTLNLSSPVVMTWLLLLTIVPRSLPRILWLS